MQTYLYKNMNISTANSYTIIQKCSFFTHPKTYMCLYKSICIKMCLYNYIFIYTYMNK